MNPPRRMFQSCLHCTVEYRSLNWCDGMRCSRIQRTITHDIDILHHDCSEIILRNSSTTCVVIHDRASYRKFSTGQRSPTHSKGFTGLYLPHFHTFLAGSIPKFVNNQAHLDHLRQLIGQIINLVELEACSHQL
ncbi:hypothetical protein TNCV_3572341 [Trichonephila clavipes]|nr:hypothetical protein TNCV_3572341 [Trichonephila clavipes]